jgi:putative CocE/NonD family hydrolase
VATLDFGPKALNRIDDWHLDFFSRTLRVDGTSRPAEHRVRVFVTGRNDWATYETWPPPHEPRTFYLHGTRANSVSGDGSLSVDAPGQEPPDVFTYDPASPSPSLGGRSCCFPTVAPMGPVPQNALEEWNSVLVYTSRPLERELVVAGEVVFTLFAATSEADTDWVFRLCDVGPEGLSINIADSIQRARFRHGTDEERLLPADEVAEFTLRSSCAHLFRPGHRLRLHVASSSFPMWDRNLNTGGRFAQERLADRRTALNTVFHDDRYSSRLTLPIVG